MVLHQLSHNRTKCKYMIFSRRKTVSPHLHHFCLKAILWNGWYSPITWSSLKGTCSICSWAKIGFTEWKIQIVWIAQSGVKSVYCVYNNVDSATHNTAVRLSLEQCHKLHFCHFKLSATELDRWFPVLGSSVLGSWIQCFWFPLAQWYRIWMRPSI